jgi:hypothetical protein
MLHGKYGPYGTLRYVTEVATSVFVLGWISPSPSVINMVLVHLIATLVTVTVTAEQTSECAGIVQAQSERGKVAWEHVAMLQQSDSTTASLEVDDRCEDAGTQGLEDTQRQCLLRCTLHLYTNKRPDM